MKDASTDQGAQGIAGNLLATVAPRRFAQVPLDLNATTAGTAVPVVANHGRWVVTCPGCRGAQMTSVTDQRFLCNVCGNAGNGGKFRPVTWPTDYAQIGALLDVRPDVRLRNWSPGETVASLTLENKALGL